MPDPVRDAKTVDICETDPSEIAQQVRSRTVIGKWILAVAIASLVVQLLTLAIAVFWTIEILQTFQSISQLVHPSPTPTSPWSW